MARMRLACAMKTLHNLSCLGYNGPMNKRVQQYLSEIGKKGGEAKTPAKKRASRENGKKGGRPRKDGK
jgi:general stress protein YciG